MAERLITFFDTVLEFLGLTLVTKLEAQTQLLKDALETQEELAQQVRSAEERFAALTEEHRGCTLTPGEKVALARYRVDRMNAKADQILNEERVHALQ